MQLWFQYDNQGHVISKSLQKIQANKLQQIQLNVDVATLALINKNYDQFIQNGALVCIKPPRIIKEDQQLIVQNLKDKILLGTATQADINDAVLNFLLKVI